MALAKVRRQCPRRDSGPSRGTGRLFFKESGKFSVRVSAMRYAILFFCGHLRVRLRRAARLEPRVPPEAAAAARLDKNFAVAFACEHVALLAIPICDAALRLRRSIVERVCDRCQSFSSGGFEKPADVRPGKVAELVEAKGDVLDDEAMMAL